jgi:hypothetical protein
MRRSLKTLVVMILALVPVLLLMCSRHKKDEPVKVKYVIGEEAAKANEAEQRRKAAGNTGKSPMPDLKYDFWRGEQDLIKPAQNTLDLKIVELCKNFASSDSSTRAKIRTSIDMEEFYTLLTFSRRAAVFAIRERKADWIVKGLIAVAMIEKERIDFRDVLLSLGLLNHSATRIGENSDQLLQVAAALSEPNVTELIDGFIKRPQEPKSLRTMTGYDEVETREGIGFIGWRFHDYNPSYDLKSIAIEIAELVENDKYQPDSVVVADDLPEVWLEAEDNTSLNKALRQVRGGASVSARLRPNEHPDPNYESQMVGKLFNETIMVFLVEVTDEPVAQTLLDLAKKIKPSGYSMVGIADGRLFCLVVAKSYVSGVKSFETPKSLVRFSKGIARILSRMNSR